MGLFPSEGSNPSLSASPRPSAGGEIVLENAKTIVISAALIVGILAIGTAGFMLIEHLPVLDALYMTIITASTVGFGELGRQGFSPAGRLFTIGLIMTSITVGAYCFSLIIGYIVEGRLGTVLRRRRMEKRIEGFRNHMIVCGAGKTGREVMSEFARRGEEFVVIDRDDELLEASRAERPAICYVAGDCTLEATLQRAGIERAKGIVFSLTRDTDNIVGVLTARSMKPDLLIIARGENEESIGKLSRAGANHIILPAQLAGVRMASFALNPSVVDFLDCVTRDSEMLLLLRDLFVSDDSPLAGKMLKESRIREKSNAIVVAIRRDMEYMVNPPVDTLLRTGDNLLVLGRKDQMERLFAYAGGEMDAGPRPPAALD